MKIRFIGLFLVVSLMQAVTAIIPAQAQTSLTREEFYVDVYPERDGLPGYSENGTAIEHLKMSYKPSTRKFHIYLEMLPYVHPNGTRDFPTGFEGAFNSGGYPNGHSDLAYLYFDATVPTDPRVTVYVFNGQNWDSYLNAFDGANFRAPDYIVSSITNPSFVLDKSVQVLSDKIIFDLTIDATLINNHTPVYPAAYPWQGISLGHYYGIWFHGVLFGSSSYNMSGGTTPEGFAPGFLTNYYRFLAAQIDNDKGITTDCNGYPRVDYKGSPIPGDTYDECGVCGGNDSSCADCKGVPNGTAVYDRCGVCGGDGSTCQPCENVNTSGSILALDGFSGAFLGGITSAAKGITRYGDSKAKAFAARAVSQATAFNRQAWTTINGYPSTVLVCPPTTQGCTSVDISAAISGYTQLFTDMRKVSDSVVKKLTQMSRKRGISSKTKATLVKALTRLKTISKKQTTLTTEEIKKLPVRRSSCS